MRIAVIGSGISGLGAAWALSRRHDVTVYEADGRVGGHSHTVDVAGPDGPVAVDTGFIVYNERTYPNLVRLFDHLGVATIPSDMSFSFSVAGGVEYGGSLRGLLARPANLAEQRYRRMTADILRFARNGDRYLAEGAGGTLGELLERERYSPGFVEDYLVPMAAAIWSARPARITDYPAATFLRFFHNHGLIRLTDRPAWRTVSGGSRAYVTRLLDATAGDVRTGIPVTAVERGARGVSVVAPSGTDDYDHVVLAVHSDQALALLGVDASDAERSVLAAIRYEENLAVLHSDPALMPQRRSVWSSWNYLVDGERGESGKASLTYWMNRLQSTDPRMPLFVSLNPARHPRPDLVHREFVYAHPQFDLSALDAQRRLAGVQGVDRVWFAGAWTGYGFHEDGLRSGLDVAAALGSPAPWYPAGSRVAGAAAELVPG